MNELNLITTNEQGSAVVSARMLYTFLEVKSRFADWIKNRINRYSFVEGVDFVAISKNLENGGRELDYALTLDMAKELAMIERTEKGKEARQYFIDCEKKLRQTALTPSTTIEQTLVQLLAGQQQILTQLQADVNELMAERRQPLSPPVSRRSSPSKQLTLLPGMRKATPNPASRFGSLRPVIHQRIDEYCALHGVAQSDTYNYLYKRLLDVYGINVYRLAKVPGESTLDAVERYGHLDRVYSLVMAELAYTE